MSVVSVFQRTNFILFMALFSKNILPNHSISSGELESMLDTMIWLGCPVEIVETTLGLYQGVRQAAERHLRLYEEKYRST